MIEQLIASGHPDPWSYTPRQATAYAILAAERKNRESLETYALSRAAQHADEATDKKIRKAFEDGARQ